jgi:hypothetical protein
MAGWRVQTYHTQEKAESEKVRYGGLGARVQTLPHTREAEAREGGVADCGVRPTTRGRQRAEGEVADWVRRSRPYQKAEKIEGMADWPLQTNQRRQER